jgi:hypothetical protein
MKYKEMSKEEKVKLLTLMIKHIEQYDSYICNVFEAGLENAFNNKYGYGEAQKNMNVLFPELYDMIIKTGQEKKNRRTHSYGIGKLPYSIGEPWYDVDTEFRIEQLNLLLKQIQDNI